MVDASRRGFLRGRPRPRAEIRPPWALTEPAFSARCTRCGDCLTACPQKILVAGDGGFPTVDFARGEYFGLDEVGGEVWRLLERGCSLGAIADALVGQFDVSADRALHDVVALVTALRDASLVSVFDG